MVDRKVTLPRRYALTGVVLAGLYGVGLFGYMGRNEVSVGLWDVGSLSRSYNRRKLTYPGAWLVNAGMALFPRQRWPLQEPPPGLPYYRPLPDVPARLPHIVIVQVESLAGGAVEWSIDGEIVMPFLHELAARSVYFPNALSPVGLGGSFDADIGVMTGFNPAPEMTAYGYSFPGRPFFPGILRRAGYTTSVWANYVGEFFNSRNNHKALGIEDYLETRSFDWKTRIPKCRMNAAGDREFLSTLRERILRDGPPQFYFAATTTSHQPYAENLAIPEIRMTTGLPFASAQDQRAYAITLRYVDIALREMFDPLLPLLDAQRVVAVVYGDHTPGFSVRFDRPRGMVPSDFEKINVPLLFIGTGLPARQRADFVGITDVACTLCCRLGVRFSYGELGGRNVLVDDVHDPFITARGTYVDGKFRESHKRESAILEYGYGKLGAS